MQYNFGTGLLTFTPPGSNPTPIQCGVLKNVGLDIDQTLKELRGQYKAPVDIALADLKIAGKAKSATIRGANINAVLNGSSLNTGSTAGTQNEVQTIPGSPYQVTVTNSATYVEDLGVIDATTGLVLTRVASGATPATGQYKVTSGVYTFAAADTGHIVWISYSYTTTGGYTVAYSNTLMGAGTTFTLTLFNTYNSKQYGIKLFAVMIPKIAIAIPNADYTEQDWDFTAYANSSGKVLEAYSTE